jgi:MFS family permease
MSLINCLQLRKQRRPPTCTLTSTQSKTDLPARKLRFPNPLSSIHILLDKEISLLLFHTGFFFAAFYSITASLPSLLASIYHFNDLYIGLCYLPFGAGCILAALCNGQLLDRNFRRFAKKLNFPIKKGRQSDLKDFPIEKARLQVAIPMAYLSCVFMLLYGWLLEINGPLPVVLVLLFFTSLTMMVAFNVSATLLVDFYPKASATATAANNLVRCLLGAGATAVVNPMIDAMGRGWCFTFLSLFLVAASPMVWCVYLWGQGWREERRVREGKYEYQCDGDGRRGEDLEEAKPPVGGPRSEIGAAEKGVQERRDVSAVKHEPRCLRSPSRDV